MFRRFLEKNSKEVFVSILIIFVLIVLGVSIKQGTFTNVGSYTGTISRQESISLGGSSGPIPRLEIGGNEVGITTGNTVVWRAKLTQNNVSNTPISNAKLVFSYNFEGNKEIPAITNSLGEATFSWTLTDDSLSSCCVDGDNSSPTLYPVRIRFEGGTIGATTYAPIFVDAVQPYRGGSAWRTNAIKLVIDGGSRTLNTTAGSVSLTATLTKDGAAWKGQRIDWNSMDLGQFTNCTTDSFGKCAVTLNIANYPTNSYGVSAFLRSTITSQRDPSDSTYAYEYKSAGDSISLHLQGSTNPPIFKEIDTGWAWWITNGSAPTPITDNGQLAFFSQYDYANILSSYNVGSDTVVIDETKLNNVVNNAVSRSYTHFDGTTGNPMRVVISYATMTEHSAGNSNPIGVSFINLNSYNSACSVTGYLPIGDGEFKRRHKNIAKAFRAWYDKLTASQKNVIAGFVVGGGFDGEWSGPFSDPTNCKDAYKSAVGSTDSNIAYTHLRNLQRETELSWSTEFNGTGVPIYSQAQTDYGAGLMPPVNSKFSILGEPQGISYKSSHPQQWNWVAIGRAKNRLLGCEDLGQAIHAGAPIDKEANPPSTPEDPSKGYYVDRYSFEGHWAVAWNMVLYAMHFRCSEINADPVDPDFYSAFDRVKPDGTPAAGIYKFDDVTRELVSTKAIENRKVIAWAAHEASYKYRKTDPALRTGVVGYSSDFYGDADAGIVRREVDATTALYRSQIPASGWTSYFVGVFPQPGKFAWKSDWRTPNETNGANPPANSAGLTARQGTAMYFDIYDAWAATHTDIRLEVTFVNDNANDVVVEWTTAAGSSSQNITRGTGGGVQTAYITLTNFQSRHDVFSKNTDLKISGANSSNVTLVYILAYGDASNIATVTPTSTPSGATNTPTATAVTGTFTPTPTATNTNTPTVTNTPTSTPVPTNTPAADGYNVSDDVRNYMTDNADTPTSNEIRISDNTTQTYGTKGVYHKNLLTGEIEFTPSTTAPVLTATPTPATMGSLTFEAESGHVVSPFAVSCTGSTCIEQSITTAGALNGGRAAYKVTIVTSGVYTMTLKANVQNSARNCVYANIDSEPQNYMKFTPQTFTDSSTFADYQVSWVGLLGTDDFPQFNPAKWYLTSGTHTVILRGCKQFFKVDQIKLGLNP